MRWMFTTLAILWFIPASISQFNGIDDHHSQIMSTITMGFAFVLWAIHSTKSGTSK